VVEDETGSFMVEEVTDCISVGGGSRRFLTEDEADSILIEDVAGSILVEEGTGSIVVEGRTDIMFVGAKAGNTRTEVTGNSALNIFCFFSVKDVTLLFEDNGFGVVLTGLAVVVVESVETVDTLMVVVVMILGRSVFIGAWEEIVDTGVVVVLAGGDEVVVVTTVILLICS